MEQGLKVLTVTVRGDAGDNATLLNVVQRLAYGSSGQIRFKLRVSDGVFPLFAASGAKCFCHVPVHALEERRMLLDARSTAPVQPDDSGRVVSPLWEVSSDEFDLLRSLGAADALVFFPFAPEQMAEAAILLSQALRNGSRRRVAIVGWDNRELNRFMRLLGLNPTAKGVGIFPQPETAEEIFRFLTEPSEF